ncbi:hypothetical protein PTTG_27330 [Puccinia triticina 1-1 BBBD Race 1]|uniref:Uncharacterized protein n=2 Tax=Puccinia triticina TaxID=208348 RepID=A0A180GLG5_PUCT1|nr:uncharacterized protein PtA15_6A161 [Puccinia triticina]OAV93391.1 hypothetical protein PTTG_27330 [Puccinia triticina 1-1 BBBD Race 1]WAQ85533.1 hypothetical protein PtA15_6A161 [Puccinia triticina]WAR55418.1 hypothetical protein PtB15_6B159 [Puccinia triticina]
MLASRMKNNSLYLILVTSITVLSGFNSTLGDGIFNNIENAKLIQSSSIVPTDGNYVFKNVGTGQTIQHDRVNDVPNIYTSGDGGNSRSVFPSVLHHPHNRPRGEKSEGDDSHEVVAALELRSHKTRTKWISIRTTATDGDPKCISAQWGYHTEGGADHAGTLYECVVDPLNLEATLEKPKQWWLLMPVGAAKNLNFDQTLDLKNEILSQNKHMKMKDTPIVSRIVDDEGKGSIDQLPAPFWNPKTNRIENFSSPDKTGKSKRNHEISGVHQSDLLRKRQLGNSLPINRYFNTTNAASVVEALKEISNPDNDAQDVNRADESTLNTLDKRSTRHHGHSKSAFKAHQNTKEADPSSGSLGPFYVVSVDHLYDMETRVWTSAVKKTVGNQLSLVLKKLDPNDKSQQWYLEVQT